MNGVHAAIVTHFDANLAVDLEGVATEVDRLINDGIHGIVTNGTMGEGGTLTSEERRAITEIAVTAASGRVPVCAGISATTAEAASNYAREAKAGGATSLMVMPPLLYRADQRELLEFFGTVGRATELPLMIYNNPQANGSDLRPTMLGEVARNVPSVGAIKETSGDARRIAELVNMCPDIDVMVGGDDWALEGFCAGASGWISGAAVVLPVQSVRLWDLCAAGDLPAARDVYAELLPLARLDMTPKLVQCFKAAMDELGIGGGPCRPPRLPLTDDELTTVRQAIEHASRARV